MRLTTPEECEQFARNALAKYPLLAQEARRRSVELRAIAHGASSDAEREALECVYALDEVATQRNGRRTRASRTWQSIARHGVLETVERVLGRPNPTAGYIELMDLNLQDFTFEAVVLKYPSLFKPETLERARTRVEERGKA